MLSPGLVSHHQPHTLNPILEAVGIVITMIITVIAITLLRRVVLVMRIMHGIMGGAGLRHGYPHVCTCCASKGTESCGDLGVGLRV